MLDVFCNISPVYSNESLASRAYRAFCNVAEGPVLVYQDTLYNKLSGLDLKIGYNSPAPQTSALLPCISPPRRDSVCPPSPPLPRCQRIPGHLLPPSPNHRIRSALRDPCVPDMIRLCYLQLIGSTSRSGSWGGRGRDWDYVGEDTSNDQLG